MGNRAFGETVLSVILAVTLIGCAKPSSNPHGWITYDVPAAATPPGWHILHDAVSGVTMAVPQEWLDWHPSDQAQTDAFFDRVRRMVPGASHTFLGLQQIGVVPNLFAMDSSKEALLPLVFTNLVVMYMDGGKSADLDKVEKGLRAESPGAVEHLELPIGPCVGRYLDSVQTSALGKQVPVRTTTLMFMNGTNLYFVRLTAPAERYPVVRPILDQILKTIRVTAPNPNAAVVTAPPGRPGGLGGPGMMPGDAGYGSVRAPNQPTSGTNGSQGPPNSVPSEPPPGPGVPTNGSTGSGEPPQNPPASGPPGQDQTNGTTGQVGGAGGGQ